MADTDTPLSIAGGILSDIYEREKRRDIKAVRGDEPQKLGFPGFRISPERFREIRNPIVGSYTSYLLSPILTEMVNSFR